MEAKKIQDKISIELTSDEALILHAWLNKYNEIDEPKGISHQSEERVLFDLEALLEKNIDSIFSTNYSAILNDARERTKDGLS